MKLTICSALFLVAGVALAQAAPLEPNEASDTLTIQADSQLSGSCGGSTLPNPFVGIKFDRLVVKSGGTVETFTLPPEKVLVVTTFDWSVSGDPGGFANRSRTALLFRTTGGGEDHGPSAQSTALADSNGRAGGAEVFPTGIVLQNPGIFCLEMDSHTPGEVIIGVINGFLARDK